MQVSVDYTITRYKDLDSGKLFHDQEIVFDDFLMEIITIDLVVTGHYIYEAGNYTGHPDMSYPENIEYDIDSICDKNGENFPLDSLSMKEYRDILVLIEDDGNSRIDDDDYY